MNWLNYLLQVNLYLILFYGFYRILLRSETFFNLNRGYLVASAALAFFIPLMQSEWVRSWFVTEQISQTITTLYDPQVFYVQASEQAHTLTLGDFMAVFYIIGILFGIARFGGNLVFLGKLMRRKIIQRDSKQAFSFFNVLFVSKELKNRSTIMKHEFVHIRQLHSADVLLFELIAIFSWFNPVVYLYKSSIKHIHEFIADEVASRNEASKADYALLLFQEQFGVQAIPLTNNFFNQSLLKLRIKMLQKERSAKTAMMKYGLIAPLFMLMIVVSSATIASKELAKIEEKVEEISDSNLAEVIAKPSESVSETLLKDNIDLSKAFIISPDLVDEVKRSSAFSKYLMKNLRYPQEARKDFITGISYIGFSVNKEGKINNIKVLTEKSPLLSREVIRVLQTIENVNRLDINEPNDYVLPVNFGLEINRGNGTRNILSSDPILQFKDKISLSDIVIMGYADEVSGKVKRDTINPNKTDLEIFTAVEQPAEFEGGKDAFIKFLQENIKYPAAARKANISGKVFVQLTVNTDGTVEDVNTINSLGYGIDEEAMRVIQLAKWTPGKQSGKALRNRIIVPINFQLPKSTEIFTAVEQNAEYPGGMKAFGQYLQENLKYPESAQKANHTGKVYIQFIVNTDGSADDFSVLKSTGDNDLDNEALRVLKLAKWIPGKQSGRIVRSRFTVPINFELAEEKITSSIFSMPGKGRFVIKPRPKLDSISMENPLYIVDGKERYDIDIENKIDPKTIDKIEIFKEEKAIMRYGEKGKNGVIVITSKKK
jgi:TonB family protein